MSRIAAVIGDIHGESELLALLLKTVRERFGPDVDFYQVGDMIDRGPDSKGVIQLCIDNGIHSILGNHETWLHKYLMTGEFDDFALNKMMAGDATLKSYGVTQPRNPGEIERQLKHLMPKSHREFILGLPIWRKISMPGCSYRLVHTGVKESDARLHLGAAERRASEHRGSVGDALCEVLATQSAMSLLWTSPNIQEPNLYRFPDGSCQIFGHSPVRTPVVTKWWIAIDTGSGTRPPNTLSAVVLPSREIVSVNSLSGKTDPGGFSQFDL